MTPEDADCGAKSVKREDEKNRQKLFEETNELNCTARWPRPVAVSLIRQLKWAITSSVRIEFYNSGVTELYL